MDPSSAGVVMLLTVVGLPAAIGALDAFRNGRGILGWIISLVAATVGGIATMLLVVNFANIPFSEAKPPPNEVIAFAQIFGGLIVGALLALWIVNRFR